MTAPCNIVPTSLRRVRAAVLSAVLPGLGQLTQGRRHQALTYFAITLLLIALSLGLGRISDRAAEVFFFMLFTLPWWAIQSYDAYLGPSDSSADLDGLHPLAATPFTHTADTTDTGKTISAQLLDKREHLSRMLEACPTLPS